jgi:hypothetical protein
LANRVVDRGAIVIGKTTTHHTGNPAYNWTSLLVRLGRSA